jgi:hypothetical protein
MLERYLTFIRASTRSHVILRLPLRSTACPFSTRTRRKTNGQPNMAPALLCVIGRDETIYRAGDKASYSGEGA